jgi:hypothetical protein
MNLDAQDQFLEAAERALDITDDERHPSEISFLQRLLRQLGGRASAARLSPAELFQAVMRNRPLLRHSRYVIETLATPSQQPEGPPRAGDIMLRVVPGSGDVGQVSVLASAELLTQSMLSSEGIAAEGERPGYYGLVIEAGAIPRRRSRPFARRLLDSRGRVPPNTMLLRPRFPEVEPAPEFPPDDPELEDPPPAAEQLDDDIVEDEIFEDFDLFAEDDPTGTVAQPVAVAATPATIGFEFDLNIGLSQDVFTARAADMPSGATFPGPSDKVTDHRETDSTGKVIDGFDVKVDGPRIEIATMPIKVDDDTTFDAVVKNVLAFAKELEAERAKVTPDLALSVANISGHPVRFTHPRTRLSKFPLVVAVRGPQTALTWPPDKGVWASPQATVTILLEHVGDLIDAIAKSVGDGLGKALSGDSSQRLGVRSDIVVKAKRRVLADRTARIGTELSDKTKVTAADYSQRLAGLLTLMTSYMLCGEIIDSNDYEFFAKAYLPINVKAPFRDLFRDALSARERMVFKELYFNNRANFFALAKDRATTSDEGKELFPPKVRTPDLSRFHSSPLTWGMLLDNTVNDTPLKVTKANSVPKKHHALGDEVLWAPISKIIPFSSTKPRVALELRRIGFAAHAVKTWEPLMKTVRALVRAMP